MTELPIDAHLPDLVRTLRDHRSLVLVAEPGAGKTTRVPPALLDSGLLSRDFPGVVLLQPRRVAARAVASRIAEERGGELGGEVGYQVRFERRISKATRLQVVTEGILTRRLVSDPFLEGIGAVILDEFHERSIHTDLALALLKESRDAVREDLILIVMSATLDAEPVARHLGGVPIARIPGRTFPVEIRYRDPGAEALPSRVASAVEEIVTASESTRDSDVLVFLPGMDEIRRGGRALESLAARFDLDVLPLHGSLSAEAQDRALRPSKRRKVVLSTNIAETSLTIDGVSAVIDAGLAREASYDPAKGLDRLELKRISKASAAQRAGRAGRTRPGVCVRLWPEREMRGLPDHDAPEIKRVDLAGTVLALRAWGHPDTSKFGWFEPPDADRVASAETLLTRLGALASDGGAITDLGRRLLEIPAHPRLARLLIAAHDAGVTEAGATLAALLSEKDLCGPEFSGGERGDSDLLVRLDLFRRLERDRFAQSWRERGVDPNGARRVAQLRDDFLRMTRRWGVAPRLDDEEALLKCVVAAFPDRVVKRRGEVGSGVMVGGRGVRLDRSSVVREGDFFLALDPREDRRGGTLEAKVRTASIVHREWLDELFPDAVRKERTVEFDETRRTVVGVSRTCYLDLVLKEDRNASVAPDQAAKVLARALAPRALDLLDDAGRVWLARLDLLKRAMPERAWPTLDEDDWREIVEDAARGRRSEDEVKKAAWSTFLRNRLDYAQGKALDEFAPETLTVPSGNRIKLEYAPDAPPVLAVRLSELFGWTSTPKIAGGRVSVLLHILGPNYRPVQITSDLAGFWASTYFQVRKDLRNRYPKHPWPDDPLTAKAEARGGRRPV